MAMSGITIEKEAKEIYKDEFKMNGAKLAIILFQVVNEKKIDITKKVDLTEVDSQLEEAKAGGFTQLPDEPNNLALTRYLLTQDLVPKYATLKLVLPDGKEKLTFISWIPNDSNVRLRMCSSTGKDALTKQLEGLQIKAECHDVDELSYKEICSKARN